MKVAFAGRLPAALVEPVLVRLTVPCDVIVDDEVSIVEQLGDRDMLVSMSFSRDMAQSAKRLCLLQVPGAGLDRIDLSALRPGIRLANVYGHEVAIAEYVIGAMISLTRSFCRLDRKLRQGEWESRWAVGRPAIPLQTELKGKTLAILGLGHIGQEIARRANAFEMRIVALRRDTRAMKPAGVSEVSGLDQLDSILSEADFVAITLPLSDETRNLIDTSRLQKMKPTAHLVNVARGEIVDEGALYRALADKQIAGAAVDVWYRYPTNADPTLPSTEPFHELDNVLMTPHMSAATEGMLEERAKLIAENIERTARGEAPLNEISPSDQ
jgi:phosphoglycerate dehydrogenase-like enzyme